MLFGEELGVAVREIRACAALSEFFALVCCATTAVVGTVGGHGGGARQPEFAVSVGPSCLCYFSL